MEISQLSGIDYVVIGCYLTLLVAVGFVFRSFTSDAADYFIGGHKVAWWMAGASAFMMNFSAYTFTGLAGLAYRHGLTALVISWNSMAFYFVGFLFFAALLRQTRCITAVQIIRERFGRATELFSIFVGTPGGILGGGVWLYGLSIFVTTILGIDKDWSFMGLNGISCVIIGVGAVICLYSTVGGSWAVQAVDFMQAVILLPITLLLAVLTLVKVGGAANLIERLPAGHFNPINDEYSLFWLCLYLVQNLIVGNQIGVATRYLSVRDGRAARKVALLASVLFFIGPIIWYIPPMAARFLIPILPDSLAGFNRPEEGIYALMTLQLLPAGLVGLMVSAMFAATISSMDTSINGTAGVFVINIYKGWIRKKAATKEMLVAGRICNLFCGTLVVLTALFYSTLKGLGVFKIMLVIIAAIGLPSSVPFFLMLIFRRTPWWSAIVSTTVGALLGIIGQCATIPQFQGLADLLSSAMNWLGLPEFWVKLPWSIPVQILTIVVFSGGLYLLSGLFWRRQPGTEKEKVRSFYQKMVTKVDADKEIKGFEDHRSLKRIGILVMIVSSGVLCLILIPSYSLSEQVAVLCLSAVLGLFGFILYRQGRKSEAIWAEKIKALKEETKSEN